MKNKNYPNTALSLKLGSNPQRIYWQVDSETTQLVKEIQEMIQILFSLKVSKPVIARRALLLLHQELSILAMEGANPKFASGKNRSSMLVRFMEKVETARDDLFQAANRPQSSKNPKYGRLPSCKALTGYELDTGAIAKKLARRLKGLC